MGVGMPEVGSVSDTNPMITSPLQARRAAWKLVLLSSVRKRIHRAKERAGFRGDGGISINQARPSQLADVAPYRPDDAGGERDRHPEDD